MATEQTPEKKINSTPQAMRLASLRIESGIKSIGQLCYLVAFFSILGTLEFTLFAIGVIPRDELKDIAPGPLLDILIWTLAGLFAINSVAQVVLGYGLIRLFAWARWTVIGLTVLSLFSNTMSSLVLCLSDSPAKLFEALIGFTIPGRILGFVSLIVGGAIHLLILWPLITPGANLVFSKDYRELVQETPEIKSRMHWLLKVLIACILIGFFGMISYLAAIFFRFID